MAITDVPILSMLRTKMNWAQERQKVLAQNVANADTPNYRGRDLVAPKFQDSVAVATQPVGQVVLAATEPGHVSGSLGGNSTYGTTNYCTLCSFTPSLFIITLGCRTARTGR